MTLLWKNIQEIVGRFDFRFNFIRNPGGNYMLDLYSASKNLQIGWLCNAFYRYNIWLACLHYARLLRGPLFVCLSHILKTKMTIGKYINKSLGKVTSIPSVLIFLNHKYNCWFRQLYLNNFLLLIDYRLIIK